MTGRWSAPPPPMMRQPSSSSQWSTSATTTLASQCAHNVVPASREIRCRHGEPVAGGHHDVGRLDVPVHDIHPVHVGEHRGDLRGDRRLGHA